MSAREVVEADVVSPADVSPEPWANGLGTTRVLAERLGWRISVAELKGRMPFSRLRETDRILIPLTEEEIVLTMDGQERRVRRTEGISFSGESRVIATTSAASSVLNVMTRRPLASTSWRIRRRRSVVPVASDAFATVVLQGRVRLDGRALVPGTVVLGGARPRELDCDDALVAEFCAAPTLAGALR